LKINDDHFSDCILPTEMSIIPIDLTGSVSDPKLIGITAKNVSNEPEQSSHQPKCATIIKRKRRKDAEERIELDNDVFSHSYDVLMQRLIHRLG